MLHDMRLVRRNRVVELLREATASALTIVGAPFGYGKTVAVEQFVESGGHRVVWVDVHRMRGSPLPHPQSVGSPREPTLVVLEDLQLVDDPALLEQLAQLVEGVPPHVRLLATTRRPLDLPVARWRAQGMLAEVGLDELRFRFDEVAAAFGHDPTSPGSSASMSAEDLADLQGLTERSEGWAAGLRLLSTAEPGGGRGPLDADAGRALLDGVLVDQPDDVREFLITTSPLFRFNAELCRVVTGSTVAGRLLDRVGGADLFLLPLDDEQVWFRYQRLFAELLRARLRDRRGAEAEERRLHRRAAGWFLDHDEPDAIGHLVAAGDGEQALDLLSADIDLASRGGSSRDIDWSTVFPSGWIAETPARMIYVAAVMTRTGWLDEAAGWLDSAERALQHRPADEPAHSLLAAARTVWHAVHGDPQRTIEVGDRAMALLPDAPSTPSSRRLLITMATAHLLLDHFDEAEAYCTALDDTQSPEIVRGLVVPAVRARVAERRGRLTDAENLARRSLGTADALQQPFHAASREARMALARVLSERGAFEDAEALVLTSIEMYEERGWTAGTAVSRVELARLRAGRDGAHVGLAVLDDVRRAVTEAPLSPVAQDALDTLEARLRIEVGDLDRATELIGPLRQGTERQLLRAALALARRDTRLAAELLDVIPVPDVRTRILTDLTSARIAAARGDHDTRDRRLLDAATVAVREGFCRTFPAEAPELLPVLRGLAESRRQLLPLVLSLDVLQAAGPGGPSTDQVLSRRELSVLRYLPSDLTNPEIAMQLGIATNTLKTHVRSLYRKLGVGSRAAAIRSARTSGLL